MLAKLYKMGSRLCACCGNKDYTPLNNEPRILSEDEIQLLLENTTMSRQQIIDYYESFREDNPTGTVTRKQFSKMFKDFHSPNAAKQSKADKFCDYVFNALESDAGDVIEFADFVVLFSITSNGNLEQKIAFAFKIYDLDKNKVINKYEMEKVLDALYDLTGVPSVERKGDSSPKNKVNQMMEQMDKNADNVLSFKEFLDGCLADKLVRKILIDPMFNC